MKTILTIAAALALTCGAYAQGNIKFQNGTTTRITFGAGLPNAGSGLAPGTAYIVGLYLGNAGSTEAQLTLFKTTTISAAATSPTHAFAGVFNGGNPTVVTGFSGLNVAFMVKAWSAGYASYEAALATPTASTLAGKSALGSYTLAVPPAGAADIMAPTPTGGQVSGFSVTLVPEPASASLLGLGLASLLIFRRRK